MHRQSPGMQRHVFVSVKQNCPGPHPEQQYAAPGHWQVPSRQYEPRVHVSTHGGGGGPMSTGGGPESTGPGGPASMGRPPSARGVWPASPIKPPRRSMKQPAIIKATGIVAAPIHLRGCMPGA